MTAGKYIFWMAIGAALGALLPQDCGAVMPSGGDIAAVVGASNPVDNLSVPDLRQILLGERRFWRGNVQIRIVLPPVGSRERARLLGVLLKMNEPEFARHWREKVFRAEAPDEPPAAPVGSNVSLVVSQTPGTLAFVLSREVGANCKILKLNGKLPGEDGYALK